MLTYTFSLILSRAESRRAWEAGVILTDFQGRYQTPTDGMSITNCASSEEWWHTLLLRWLSEMERIEHPRLVPDNGHGGMNQVAGLRYDIFHNERKQRILPSENFQRRSQKDSVHISPWGFPFTRISFGLKIMPQRRLKEGWTPYLRIKWEMPLFI